MRFISLTGGYVTTVDDEDFEALSVHKWCADVKPAPNSMQVYAVRNVVIDGHKRLCMMHREIIRPSDSRVVDHRDGDGLNNQRANLREATYSQNLANQRKTRGSSAFKGVYLHKASGKWLAQIKAPGRSNRYIGLFKDEADAATAYNFAAYEEWGEFARMNVPLD